MDIPDHPLVFSDRRPVYGKDYDRGWLGFNHSASTFSTLIEFIDSWRKTREITISHVFIVADEDLCIEAAYPKGVVESSLTEEYFDHPKRYVIFRKPKGLTDELADRLVETARRQLGKEFDHAVVANHALTNNFAGWVINEAFGGKPQQFLDELLNDKDEWICSELAAYCLNEQPEFSGLGVLKRGSGAITPQMLFEADELFEPLCE